MEFLRCAIADLDGELVVVLLNHNDRIAIRGFIQTGRWLLHKFYMRPLGRVKKVGQAGDGDPLTSSLMEDAGDKAERGCAPTIGDLRVTGGHELLHLWDSPCLYLGNIKGDL